MNAWECEAVVLYSSRKHGGKIISLGRYSKRQSVKDVLEDIKDDAISFWVVNGGSTLARKNCDGMIDTNHL